MDLRSLLTLAQKTAGVNQKKGESWATFPLPKLAMDYRPQFEIRTIVHLKLTRV